MNDTTPKAGGAPTPPKPTEAELALWLTLVAKRLDLAGGLRAAAEQAAELVEALRALTDVSPRAGAFLGALREEG